MAHQLNWVKATAELPIYFSMVREDPLLDLGIVQSYPNPINIIMIASGGCTASLLATEPKVSSLHLVDPNPSQLALCRVKFALLQHSTQYRKAILGHATMAPNQRRSNLEQLFETLQLSSDCLGPLDFVAEVGPDFAGRYERLFYHLHEAFAEQRDSLISLLHSTVVNEQSRAIEPNTPLGQALDLAFDTILDLPILVELFGAGATQNRVEPFARHFAKRTRHALTQFPAAMNPYLWLMLKNQLPPECDLPWLQAETPTSLPTITFSNGMMAEVLRQASSEYEFVHLSNILDWLPAEEAERTLDAAWQALKPGGVVLIRQLNSTLDIPRLSSSFRWDSQQSAIMLQRDRSFFYRAIHLGRKS